MYIKGLRESGTSFADDTGVDAIKREAAWDMDYGWGGGRFGKRMDSLGIAGRFGRSVNGRSEEKIRRQQWVNNL